METDKKDLIKYLSSIGQEFSSKVDRISHLIGDEHYPSTGRYRERILMQVISRFLPKRYDVGTGFVLFPSTGLNHEISKEIDIIIYDSNNYSTIYQDDDFVIVKPESVRAVIEVKSTLSSKTLKSSTQNFIDFAQKWNRFGEYEQYRWENHEEDFKTPGLFVMNWSVALKSNGNVAISPKTVAKNIVKIYQESGIDKSFYGKKFFPFIVASFIYNRSIIFNGLTIKLDGSVDYGYSVGSGKFDDVDQKYTFCGDDKTITYLLYYIDLFLDTSIHNTIYTRPNFRLGTDRSESGGDATLFSFSPEELKAFYSSGEN